MPTLRQFQEKARARAKREMKVHRQKRKNLDSTPLWEAKFGHMDQCTNANENRPRIDSKTNDKSWERDYQEEERIANQAKYKENAKRRDHFETIFKSFIKQKAPNRPDQAFIVKQSALDYKGGTTNDARAQANPDRYNPQFLPDETYFDVWGDDYREWFRLQANKRRREDEKKKTNGAKRKRNGGEKHNLENEEEAKVENEESNNDNQDDDDETKAEVEDGANDNQADGTDSTKTEGDTHEGATEDAIEQ